MAGVAVFGYWRGRSAKKSESSAPARPSAPPTEDILEQSLRDNVTGLYNRKHLLRRLSENAALCDRKNEQMAVVLWDLDGFVEFNNKYGQSEGDRLLKKVADTIRKSLRVYDEAFRSGPDEFCGILIPADEMVAGEVRRRVAQIVSKNLFEGDREFAEQKFSISSGLVFYPGDYRLPEAILHAAHQSLYRSQVTQVES
jgi:diguanylate cyclase (GGDEF)-like protein